MIASFTSPLMFPFYLAYLLMFWAQSGVFTTISLFGQDVLRISVEEVSLLFAVGGILGAIIQGFAIEKIADIIPEEKLFILGSVVSGIGFLVMAKTSAVLFFAAGMTVFSLGNSLVMPVIQSLLSEKSSEHEQGENLGFLQSFGSIGRIVGPVSAGYVYEKIGPHSPSLMGAYVTVLVSLLGLKLISRR